MEPEYDDVARAVVEAAATGTVPARCREVKWTGNIVHALEQHCSIVESFEAEKAINNYGMIYGRLCIALLHAA